MLRSIKTKFWKTIYKHRALVRSIRLLIRNPTKIPRLLSHMRKYNKLNTRPEFHASIKNLYPCLNDWDAPAGTLDYYFWQDLWAAKKIFQARPSEHYDIGSRVDGFVAHVLSFMPVTMIDIRPLKDKVEGLNFIQSDATNLENISDNSIISLSSLCAPEHFGLGRYGDPIDPEACFQAMRSMSRVLKKDGHLYIAVPVGKNNCVEFNAHRIFKPELVIDTLNELTLVDFSVVCNPERGIFKYFEHIDLKRFHELDFGRSFADGLFEFVKQ